MVNPRKHANNLNEEDLEKIYSRLNQQFMGARDFRSRKEINQQLLIFILACKRFGSVDLIRIPSSYFKNVARDDILYEPISRHIKEGYCELDGLLLTNHVNNPYKQEDVDKLLSNINMGSFSKVISIDTLNKTKSRFNDYGEKCFDKHKLKEYLNLRESLDCSEEKVEKEFVESRDTMSNEDIVYLKEKVDKLADEVQKQVEKSQTFLPDEYLDNLEYIKQRQEILEDSLSNRYNQLSGTMNNIHQKVKSFNKKYKQLNDNIVHLGNIASGDSLKGSIREYDARLDEVMKKLEDIKDIQEDIYRQVRTVNSKEPIGSEDMSADCDGEEGCMDFPKVEYKEFMYGWFTKNMKITRNPHDVVDMKVITNKLEKYLDSRDISVDRAYLFNRLESYLSYWYNSHDTVMLFRDIKSENINGGEFYSNIRFIDFNLEHENRIKNSIIAWLRENTREAAGAKTYTRDIFNRIEPIFEENGWIITDNEEWRQLHDAGYTKVCPKRTFSQIIGKSVQFVYNSIGTRRDVPRGTGNITWYPDLEIIDKEVSSSVHSMMKNELTGGIMESDNIICKWLDDNLIYTDRDSDETSITLVREKLLKHFEERDIHISKSLLGQVFVNSLEKFLSQEGIVFNRDVPVICKFILKDDTEKILGNKIACWMECHLIPTENPNDRVYLEDIREKLISYLYQENLTVVSDDIYLQLPNSLKGKFIEERMFRQSLEGILDTEVNTRKVEDNVDGTYFISLEFVKYKKLEQEHVTGWIEDNIEELLKSNVAYRNTILDEFRGYLSEHNIVNRTGFSLEEVVDRGIRDYYFNNSKVSLKQVNDTENDYYILI